MNFITKKKEKRNSSRLRNNAISDKVDIEDDYIEDKKAFYTNDQLNMP